MSKNHAGETLRGRPFSVRANLKGANFCKATLRGVNFKGLDLSESNFTNADIRGADFTGAILQGANFTGARAGLQKRWIASQFIILMLPLVIFSFAVGVTSWVLAGSSYITLFLGAIFAGVAYQIPFASELYLFIPIIVTLAVNAIVLITIIRQGFTSKAFATITTLMVTTVTVVVTISIAIAVIFIIQYIQNTNIQDKINNPNTFTDGEAVLFSIIISFLFGFVVLIAFTVTIASAVAVTVVFAAATAAVATIAVGFPLRLIDTIITLAIVSSKLDITVLPVCLVVWVGTRIAKQSLEGNEKFAIVSNFAINFATIGGTNFYQADLSRANFTNAVLKNTNFRVANLTQVYWKNAQNLDRSRLGNSYLQNPQIRQLVTTLEAQGQNFDRLDFRGINLQEANLRCASFIDTDLSQANLQGADLFEAKLVQTNLDQANLSNAFLTGAYIEDWGITRKTRLDNVQCKYIYLKLPTKGDRDPNRMPPATQGEFGENDFNIFITSVLDTLDLYHRDNINAGLAITILKGLTEDYPVKFELVGLEKRGDEQFVIRLKVFGQTSHFQLQHEYYTRYEQTLPLYDPKKLISNTDAVVEEIIKTVKENPGTRIENLHNQGIVVTGGSVNMTAKENRFINIDGGNYNELDGGNYNELIEGNYIQGNYYAATQQNLIESAAQIQHLLKQLEQSYPSITTSEQMVIAAKAIEQIENDPTLKQRVINAIKEGGLAAFEKAIDNPAGAFIVGAIKGWQEVET
ncbi:pentapeptide repeat-containing protein [Nostoc punctiforme FACHB-252]|uniref:Pentapeptide repeat-containing protein n=2 Tax=Nostoc TaxID=1177 RepID=A0ABR8HBD2_NOSPU|nr:pentapeptide repeat-containing protein [Nostoc punctiforme]MBD2612939.1 pentapeptide repeat-containing protein [Nostoc punctiforme FACHB-252]